MGKCQGGRLNRAFYRRVGGFAADAVIVISKIIPRESDAASNHRVDGVAVDPTG